jgi:hypothetical protein
MDPFNNELKRNSNYKKWIHSTMNLSEIAIIKNGSIQQ